MPVASGNRKLCAACGADVTFAKRVRNPTGGFLCEPCAPTVETRPADVGGRSVSTPAGPDPVTSTAPDDVGQGDYRLKDEVAPALRPSRPGPGLTPAILAAAPIPRASPRQPDPGASARAGSNRVLWIAVSTAAVLVLGGGAIFLLRGGHRPAAQGGGVAGTSALTDQSQSGPATHDDQPAVVHRPPAAPAARAPAVTARPVPMASTPDPSVVGRLLGRWHVDDKWDITVARLGGGFTLHEDYQGQAKDSSQWRPVERGLAFNWDDKDVFVVRAGPGDQLTIDQYPNAFRDFFRRRHALPASPGNTKVAVRAG